MKTNLRFMIVLAASLLLFAGCAKKEEAKVETRTYEGTGVVVAVDQMNGSVTIDHKEITGFMGAMAMAFPVKDTALLAGIQPNDSIDFTVSTQDTEFWVSAIQKQ